ncbi:nonmuscle myosin heavy chain b [Pholiota molesta]|nr:nonmuscle myosin heavy chain b [Pholiota molesta]
MHLISSLDTPHIRLPSYPLDAPEAARAAAQQAEFNEKKWVWVPDIREGYLAGWVNKEEEDSAEVVMASGGELFKMNPPKFDRVEDIADLTFLNEASVVHNLRLRYGSGGIYTYSGLFLVAINPYQHLPLYSDTIIHQYRGKRRDENPPHVFAVAERAWVNMGDERENQSILITGESGAGKTESTKKVIQYLAAIATDVHHPTTPSHSRSNTLTTMPSSGLPRSRSIRKNHGLSPSMSGSGSHLTAKGRLGQPILEAFGNAQTQRNNNSSRFGKFVRIMFAPDGSIAGANIDWYLLEKSRVVYRNEAERSFHVFYQLIAGGGPLKDTLLLDGQIEDYEYLNKSKREVDGIDDKDDWNSLKLDLFRVVAAILHIGNIVITSSRSDDAAMPDIAQAERVCHLLGLPIAEFTQRINRALDRPSSKATFIGVLDIAGFEIFDVNGYDTVFNHHMFVLEQEEYARENIQWDYLNFGLDLQPTIDLIESSGNTIGILSCLDEECIMPKADDRTFTNKLNAMWVAQGNDDEPDTPARPNTSPPASSRASSTHGCARPPQRGGKKRTMKKGAFRTVAQRHKEQLSSLMAQLRATQPHFVRCIVPNNLKKPGRMDVPLVLDQLRCNGVLEGIRIARLGYPNRLPFVEFRQRYEILTPGVLPKGYMDGREACRRMVNSLELDDTIFKLGTSKIFFKAGVLAELEERRDTLLFDIFSRLQAAARMWTSRRQIKKILNRANAIRTIQRNARVYGELREWPWWQLYTKSRNSSHCHILQVRPLLAATRNDEELRAKDLELALVKERAERDKQEREALEKLKMMLEADKRKVEDDLEAERALAVDKDALLERSKQRESDLEDEIAALQADIATLDSQLSRAMRLQKESEDKYENLREAFDQRGAPCAVGGLRTLAVQREEDLVRTKERMETTVAELRGKLEVEVKNKELVRDKSDQVETEARQAKAQLAELGRTASEYSAMIQKKDEQIAALNDEMDALKAERENASMEILALRADIDTLDGQLAAERQDHANDVGSLEKLQAERDELRTLLAAKTTEATQQGSELAELRSQSSKLHQELVDLRRTSLESQKMKAKRSMDSEMLSLRARQHEVQGELAEAMRTKENVERQLATAKDKFRDFEDIVLNFERDQEARVTELDTARKQLESESARRVQLEKTTSTQKAELATVKERNANLEKELNKTKTDLKAREWDVKQLLSKQDKTIVEHVHVLEEAKRVTDKQLQEAQLELKRNNAYILSLRQSKAKASGEFEDLSLKFEKELRAKEQELKAQEKRTAEALSLFEKERRGKEEAELQIHRVLRELQQTGQQAEELAEQLSATTRSKEALENELERLVDDIEGGGDSVAKLQREYETRIALLENQLDEAEMAKTTSTKIRDQIERQHAEIHPQFHAKLLREFQRAEESLQKELSIRPRNPRLSGANELHPRSNTSTPSRKALNSAKAGLRSDANVDTSRNSDRQVAALKQQLQLLEIQMAASERVRLHLEASFLEQYKARLVQENARLTQLLKEEAEARRSAEASPIDGVNAMWTKFQKAIAEERENYNRLEESRKALFAQQRTTLSELEEQRGQLRDLSHNKNNCRRKLASSRNKWRLPRRMQPVDAKRELQLRTQQDEVSQTTSSAAQAARRALAEMEKSLAKSTEEFKKALKASERKLLSQRLAAELDDEREQHQKDLSERDFAMDQTRKKYQGELAQLSEELQSQRDALSRVREENRNLRSDYDALQLKYDDEVYNSGGWKKEKERMEMKINDIERAYEASTGAQAEQQSQIVALHSQVRELRGVLDDAEADRALLQKARRALQAELETIKLDNVDSSKMSSDREYQRLQLKKQDLERSLEEQEDRVSHANERLRKAENFSNECQIELGKVRVENSELDKLNASLEKQIKELNVRIVDLETKSYANAPRTSLPGSRRMDTRIEELTNQLQQTTKERRASGRHNRMIHDDKAQQLENERQRTKLESYETQIQSMRQSIDSMQTEENNLQAAKRRAEREAVDYRQRVLSLERELEKLHSRLERPVAVERTFTGTALNSSRR